MRRALLALLAALVASGCMAWGGPHHPAAGAELDAVHAAEAAWVDAGRLAPPEGCRPLLEAVHIVYPDDIDARCQVEGAVACVLVGQDLGGPPRLLIHLRSTLDPATQLRAIVHETLHYLRGCVVTAIVWGLERGETDDRVWWGVPEDQRDGARPDARDAAHRDAELWGPIQSAAKRALR